MSDTTTSVNELVRASLRMRAMSLLMVCTMVVLVTFCLWALHGLINQVESDVRSRFQHLVFDLWEQESFLDGLIVAGSDLQVVNEGQVINSSTSDLLGSQGGVDYYYSPRRRMSLPYVVGVKGGILNHKYAESGLEILSDTMARHFSQARGGRISKDSQAFLVDLNGAVTVTIPCLPSGVLFDAPARPLVSCEIPIGPIRDLIRSDRLDDSRNSSIKWKRIESPDRDSRGAAVVLYRDVEVNDGLWLTRLARRTLVAGTYLEISSPHTAEEEAAHALLLALNRRASPSQGDGEGGGALSVVLESSHGFHLNGLHLFVSSDTGWEASYLVPWMELFRAAHWQMAGFLLLVLSSLVGSAVLYRRHRYLVVLPAKQSHDLVVESEAFSRAVIDVSKVAVVGVDVKSGILVVRNRLASDWLGDDVDIQALMSKYVVDSGASTGQLLGESSASVISGRHLSVSYGRALYRGGEVLLAAFSDVTEHHQVNSALEEARQTADAANTAKTVFLATMSHEIRTPLYGILGTIELLGLTEMTAQQRGYISTIQASSAGLLNTISDILDVSKIESRQIALKVVRFDPVRLLEEVMRTFAANAEAKGLHLYSIVSVDVPRCVQGDGFRLKQVLGNLISNAIKFSDAGWVRLSLAVDWSPGSSCTFLWKVADTGIGISDVQAVSLFEPFYQVQGAQQTTPGAGLGLYISQSLCHLMNGEILLDSAPGRGSTFTVSLPLELCEGSAETSVSPVFRDGIVWVRAPIRELAQNVKEWLERAGARSKVYTGTLTSGSREEVLVEISPDRMAPVAWPGPRVSCTPAGPELPQWGMSGVHVNEYAFPGIVMAVVMAQQNDSKLESEAAFSTSMRGAMGGALPVGGYRPAAGLERLGLKVLIAEDNQVNRSLLVNQLERLGCAVSTCADGEEVLIRWEEDSFDVLLTDINMPRMDGYEVVGILRARGVNVPIVGVSASTMQAERELGLAIGLDAWVTKPVDLATLYDTLRRVCVRRSEAVSGALPVDWLAADTFSHHMKSVFKESMRVDVSSAWQALSARDANGIMSALHRMRGALAVMNFSELAAFSEVLEVRISVDGLTPVLWNAARSTLREVQVVLDGLS